MAEPNSLPSRMALLRRTPYFSGLPDAVLAALAGAAGERRIARGQMIFLEGAPCAGLHIVAHGEVKIYKLSLQGREHVLQQLGPGGTFNEVAVLDGGTNPAGAAAVTDAVVLVITRQDIRTLAERYPALAWALIASTARRTRHLVEMVEDLALRSVKSRLAKLLLAEAKKSAAEGEIARDQMVTQAEMAARLGTVREMVGRALRELVDEGVIELDRHRIVITDRKGLAAVAEG